METLNTMLTIIAVLKKQHNPITEQELSFRARTTQRIVRSILQSLIAANMVIRQNDRYSFNPRKNEYKPEKILKRH